MIQLNDIGRDAMLEVGVSAATDVTGFGLAGHTYEMARGSGVTIVIELSRLPLLPGAEAIARRPYLTRASASNADYVKEGLRKEGKLDAVRLEFFYDAQTSGGLLISVPAGRAETLVEKVRKRGGSYACVIGEVLPKNLGIEKADLSVVFEEGETIWTESSHKYTLADVLRMAQLSGFRCEAQWVDTEWAFAENLWIAR